MKTVGLIGCGTIANDQYAMVLRSQFGSCEKLFFDLSPAAANAMAQKLAGESVSLETLINKSDFILITTPPESHYQLLLQAIMPGKAIFCEKPFLLDSLQASHILQMSRSQNATIYVGHVRRFFNSSILARNFLKTGLLGAVKEVNLFEGGRFNYNSQSGYHYTSPLGGVLPDTGSHTLDTLLYVLGIETGEVNFKRLNKKTIPDSEPSHIYRAGFTIETSYIINGNIYLSRRTNLSNKINILCENGMLEVPADMKNAVKVTTATGKTILRANNPVGSIEEAFFRQFHHVLNEGGKILKADSFLNTTKLLETLLTGKP